MTAKTRETQRAQRMVTNRLASWTLIAGLIGMAAWSAPAAAQPFRGIYLGAGGGYNLPHDVGVGTAIPGVAGNDLRTEGGFVALGSLGYGFGNGIRLELEGNYRGINTNGVGGGTNLPGSGSLNTNGVMANALFDMDVGAAWIYPYVGAGIGYVWTQARGNFVSGAGTAISASGSQGRLAAQGIAGLSFPIQGVPGLSITTEYRFFAAIGDATFDTVAQPGGARSRVTVQNQYNHNFMLGVRYAFGVTPPPGAPAAAATPAPAAARSYLVFFDWDKATLTDRARAIVKEAAEASTRVAYTRIEVNGYADNSGKAQYNQGLSVRRAQAVAAELVRFGVPRQAISIQGFGDTKLLVPTGPNTREPQNRRVEIVIR